jgi:hypothetical protein
LRRSPFLVAAASHQHIVASGIIATTTTTATISTRHQLRQLHLHHLHHLRHLPSPPSARRRRCRDTFIVTITAKLNPPTCSMDPNGEPVIRR